MSRASRSVSRSWIACSAADSVAGSVVLLGGDPDRQVDAAVAGMRTARAGIAGALRDRRGSRCSRLCAARPPARRQSRGALGLAGGDLRRNASSRPRNEHAPRVLVIDSVQTDLHGGAQTRRPARVGQLREASARLVTLR